MKPLLCVSGTILGFVDTSVKKKKNPCPREVYGTMAIVFSETSTESYQLCGVCDFSPSWNREMGIWEGKGEEME